MGLIALKKKLPRIRRRIAFECKIVHIFFDNE